MWELNNSNAYQTNEFCVSGEDYYSLSPQWDVDNGYSSYSENERDLATVLMNLKEDCKSHSNNSHEEYVHNYYNYQTNNFSSDSNLHHQHHHNNPHDQQQHHHHEQQQPHNTGTWHTPITTGYVPNEPAQRVPVYNPSMDCGYYQPTDDCNYSLLPAILDIDEEFCKVNVSSDEKKRVGRPRGMKSKRSKAEPKLSRIWEFIRDLLLDAQYCPTYICWENYEEGRFRFVQSDKVAKLWGKFKRNERMNYEKFSRAMRYYYKTGVLLPVQGKRLVYKFGPKATGWHTDNPNFKYSY